MLGKSVIDCKDTPGFIGNRIGVFWMMVAAERAIKMGLNVEEADTIISTVFGAPKTGVFGLLDLVGLDLMPHVMSSMTENLDKIDYRWSVIDSIISPLELSQFIVEADNQDILSKYMYKYSN